MSPSVLKDIQDRQEMIRVLDGYTSERMDDLDGRRLKSPLVKTQLIEVLNGRETLSVDKLNSIFQNTDLSLNQIDDSLLLVIDGDNEIGFLEIIGSRIISLYSRLKADELSKFVNQLISSHSELDYVWLSGLTFSVLWKLVCQLSKPHRYGQLVFTHESIYDVDCQLNEDSEELTVEYDNEDFEPIIERRATRFKIVDKIGIIKDKLEALQNIYSPLFAISQLRFPSPVGRGGHDFYDNGKVPFKREENLLRCPQGE